jgi:hypothetical protein
MAYQEPFQQQRYADNGRRTITVLGRTVPATRVALKESEARLLNATHEINVDRIPGVAPQQLLGQVIDFEGTRYRVTRAVDPRAGDPAMRGRYVRMICVVADDA